MTQLALQVEPVVAGWYRVMAGDGKRVGHYRTSGAGWCRWYDGGAEEAQAEADRSLDRHCGGKGWAVAEYMPDPPGYAAKLGRAWQAAESGQPIIMRPNGVPARPDGRWFDAE